MPQASHRYNGRLTLSVRTSKQKVPNRKDEVDSECCGGSGLVLARGSTFVAPFIMAVAASVVSLRRKRTGLEVVSGSN